MIIIVNEEILVNKFPKKLLIKPEIIKIVPDKTSEIATKDAKNGLKLKYSINLLGGNGNFKKP